MNSTPDDVATLYLLLGLVPVLMLVLSAGIAWGVTTATVKSLKASLTSVDHSMQTVLRDFSKWKQDRLHSVTMTRDCTDLRRACGDEQSRRIEKLTEKFDNYVQKSDERWNELAVSIKVLCKDKKDGKSI